MVPDMKPKIFLSHASGDSEVAEMFRRQAEACGTEVYLAEHDVQAGQPLAAKIQDNIRNSNAVVVLLTHAGAASAYVNQEIGVAMEAPKPVIAIVEVGVVDLAMLQGREYVPFDPSHPEGAIRRLTSSLTDLAERVHQKEAARASRQQQREMLVLLALLVFVVVALSAES